MDGEEKDNESEQIICSFHEKTFSFAGLFHGACATVRAKQQEEQYFDKYTAKQAGACGSAAATSGDTTVCACDTTAESDGDE